MNATNKHVPLSSNTLKNIAEWVFRIGTVLVILIFCIYRLIYIIKYTTPPVVNPSIPFPRLLWKSLVGGDSGLVLIFGFLVDTLIFLFKKSFSKIHIIILTITVYLITVFDNIALEYPLDPSWLAFGNFLALIFCAVIVLVNKPIIVTSNESHVTQSPESKLYDAQSRTTNKNIIAVQIYKVETSQVPSSNANETERVIFDVEHIGRDFVRSGHDINSISRMSYVLDRDIVDWFSFISSTYNQLKESGDDNIKDQLVAITDEKIDKLVEKLKKMEASGRSITKDDCCIARALTILLSFKRILVPHNDSIESQDYLLGELTLRDGDLQLKPETEYKLFTLHRTGILGAALLNEKGRHIFCYRKAGAKQGRKYCVSKLVCNSEKVSDNFSKQIMYISLFTIKESDATCIPYHVFPSITERETHITSVLHKLIEGGELNG